MLLHRQSMINCCVDQKTTTKHDTTLQPVSPPASHGWDHHIFLHPPSSHGYPVVGLPLTSRILQKTHHVKTWAAAANKHTQFLAARAKKAATLLDGLIDFIKQLQVQSPNTQIRF